MPKQIVEVQNLPESFSKYNGQWAVIVGWPVKDSDQYFVELLDGNVICVYKNQMKKVI